MRRILALLLLTLLPACSDPAPPAKPAEVPAVPTPPVEPTSEAAPTETPGSITTTIQVVDLSGAPLAHMTPIVTREPNAFDAPVASGTTTDSAGSGMISFETKERLFLRAWDPMLNYFPNNFYEVLPGGSRIEDDLTIQMVPAAALAVQLFLPNEEIAANMAVGLMLYHATRGPWWPAEGTTNADGFVTFDHLPAGEYGLRFKVESGARLEQGQTALPPAKTVDLGVLVLQ